MKLYHSAKVVKAKQLLLRLKRNALRHANGYVQYLTLTSLNGIVGNGKLHLSSRRRLNDLGETLNERMFEASFSFGTAENLAMWCLYGVPNKEAVRVTYPAGAIKDWIEEIKDAKYRCLYSYDKRSGSYQPLNAKVKRVIFADVAYGDLKIVKHGYDFFCISDEENVAGVMLEGVLKDYAWAYENEVRLVIEFDQELKDASGRKIDVVALDFESPIESLQDGRAKLTIGPWATRKYKCGKHLIAGRKMEFRESALTGLVKCRCNDSQVIERHIKTTKKRRGRNG